MIQGDSDEESRVSSAGEMSGEWGVEGRGGEGRRTSPEIVGQPLSTL